MAIGSLLGLDLGTHSAKGCAFDGNGHVLATAEISYQHDAPARGEAEMDPERWWEATREILKSLTRASAVTSVAGIGITGQAPTVILVDEDGRALRPAILWLDVRSTTEALEVGAHAYYGGPKLAWLRRHEPEILTRTATILQSHSFPV